MLVTINCNLDLLPLVKQIEEGTMTEEENKSFMTLVGLMLAKGVPDHLIDGLARYYLFGIRPGDFLSAVLSNDLRGAIKHGDDKAVAGLKPLVVFLYNNMPTCCWGCVEDFNNWAAIAKNQGVAKLIAWTKAC